MRLLLPVQVYNKVKEALIENNIFDLMISKPYIHVYWEKDAIVCDVNEEANKAVSRLNEVIGLLKKG